MFIIKRAHISRENFIGQWALHPYFSDFTHHTRPPTMSEKASALPPVPESRPRKSSTEKWLLTFATLQTLLLIGILGALASIAAKVNSSSSPMSVAVTQAETAGPLTVAVPTASYLNVRAANGTPLPMQIFSQTLTISPAFGSIQTVTAR